MDGSIGWDLAGRTTDDGVETHQTLTFTTVVVSVGGGVGIAFENGVGCEGPDFCVYSASIAVDALLKRRGTAFAD